MSFVYVPSLSDFQETKDDLKYYSIFIFLLFSITFGISIYKANTQTHEKYL